METTGPRGTAPGANPADHTWRSEVDGRGQPTLLRDPLGTQTELQWDADGNVTRLAEAAGTRDQALREMTYDEPYLAGEETSGSGRLTELTVYPDGADEPDSARATGFDYRRSGGRNTAGDGYADGEWVLDLERIIDPNSGETSFTLAPDGTGNPLARTDPTGATASATYGDGSSASEPAGVVTSETDEVGGLTRYLAFHPSRHRSPTDDGVAGELLATLNAEAAEEHAIEARPSRRR